MFKCQVCNLVLDVEEAPDECPRCGAPKEKFDELTDNNRELVEKSRETNSLLMELCEIMEQVEDISEAGIEINLDPTCLALFQKAKEQSNVLKQSAKAEIEVHVGKGKWG